MHGNPVGSRFCRTRAFKDLLGALIIAEENVSILEG
jgi:hypothetical protein